MTGLLVVALRAAFHRRLHRSLAAPREPLKRSLPEHGLTGHAIRIPTQRHRYLRGWWLPGDADRGVLVITHGWGANRELMLPLARPLQADGWNVLLLDTRNHGESDADDFSSMPRFAEDIDAAVDWLRTDPVFTDAPVGLIAHSVGGAAALLAASRRDDIAAVVSLSTFAHPADMMRRWLRWKRLPFFPVGWYILRYVERVIGHRFDDIAPIHTLPRVGCPVLLVHGEEDPVIPVDDAVRLHEHRRDTPTTLQLLPGGHDLTQHLDTHMPTLNVFLKQSLGAVDQMQLGVDE
ncbi:alpha/beta hydrolase [Guyparkeria sp.]|uniref:alpha/beta hydrolase n=1 Tax=Guyparkeria sp. TaxID=2035736 RepID=UPI003970BCC5